MALAWVILLFSDSDWAGDKNDRRSVGGYMIFLNGVLICWRSKSQKVVSLSSSEAEFYACSEAVKEIPFVIQILEFMGIEVEKPVEVMVDNVGAIYMSQNQVSSSRTRHMDTRYHYVNDIQDDGVIKVEFVRSEENLGDGFTKNVSGDIYGRHVGTYMSNKDEIGALASTTGMDSTVNRKGVAMCIDRSLDSSPVEDLTA